MRALPSARSSAKDFCPEATSRQAMWFLACPPRGFIPMDFRWCAKLSRNASLAWTDPSPFAPEKALAESLLTPTRIYVRPLLRVLAETDGIKALAHITGGGFPDNLPRVLPKGLGVEIDLPAIPVQAVFRWLAARGSIAAEEMLRTFNCGIGMVVITDCGKAAEVSRALRAAGEEPVMLGRNRANRGGRTGHPFRTARAVTIRRKRTAVLISGRGSNMRALVERARDPSYPAEIVLVLSNRPDAAGLGFAAENKIARAVVDHKIYAGREEFERSMQCLLELHRVELICLAGFMRMLTPWFVGQWKGRMLNIHPALLPAYRGLDTHARALADGVKIHGCTVHFVVPAMDEGPIIAQAAVAVLDSDTPESLAGRVLAEEHVIYPAALACVAEGRLRIEGNRVYSADPETLPPSLRVPPNNM